MNWYKTIDCDNAVPNPLVADQGDLKGLEDWQLSAGRPLEHWNEEAWVGASTSENDGEADDVLQTFLGVPIYSHRLRRSLEDAGIAGIQYLPIHVYLSDSTEVPGYCVANVTSVPALDIERSQLLRYGDDYFLEERRGKISNLMRPVLRASALLGRDIVRLEGYEASVFVSPLFKQVFEQRGFTGYSFVQVEAI
jgi:hypothetical protein